MKSLGTEYHSTKKSAAMGCPIAANLSSIFVWHGYFRILVLSAKFSSQSAHLFETRKANTGTDHIEQNIFNIKAAQHGKDLDAFNENKDNKGQSPILL